MRIAIFLSAAVLSGTCWAVDPDIESTLESYEASLNAVQSFDVHLNINEQLVLDRIPGTRNPLEYQRADFNWELRARQFQSGELFRLDCLKDRDSEYQERENTFVWDGRVLKIYDAQRQRGALEGHATIMHLIVNNCPPYALLFKRCFGDYGYPVFIRDRETAIEQSDGMIIVDAKPGPTRAINANAYGARFLLDPSKGHMPTRIEWYVDTLDVVKESTRIENELAEVQPGVWLPISSRLTFLIEEPTSQFYRQPYGTMEVTVDMERSSFNAPIDEDVFALEFPDDTEVRDRRR